MALSRTAWFGMVVSTLLFCVFGCADQSHATTDGSTYISSTTDDGSPPSRSAARCMKPEIEIGSPALARVLGSARVQLFFTAPQLYGPDASALDRELDALAERTLASNELDWSTCMTSSPLGLECPVWDVETECARTQSGKVVSVVCINRLSEAEHADVLRPSVSYSSINALRCGESLRVLDFEKDLCPSWHCLSELSESLVRAGIRGESLGAISSGTKEILGRFYLAEGHIVFLFGSSSIDNLDYDNRFMFGYNVVALTYAEFLLVAPAAVGVLREAGLMPIVGG